MSTLDFRFEPAELPPQAEQLRRDVRAFAKEATASGLVKPDYKGWSRHDRAVSREIGKRGWIGMTWPKAYGGHERSALERYVVTEELLASGLPLRAHWSADRQNGPLILEYGTEWQKKTFLPQFAAGEEGTAIGLSEPDSGSDLASIRTRAVKVDGGWKVNGRKVWTSNAHNVNYLILLLRTGAPGEGGRHGGMTRFLVDLRWKGITIRPITQMTGEHDFNEVTFDDCFMPDEMVIGEVGGAWKQLGGELALERSAPDRWTAVMPLLKMLIDRVGPDGDRAAKQQIGRLVSQLWTLKSMSLSVFGMLEKGENPTMEASLVKDLGTHYEQEIPHIVRALYTESQRYGADADAFFNEALRFHALAAPSITIRGGTKEILRNAIARGLGLR